MSQERKSQLSGIFSLAWQFVKRNGLNLQEALRLAWANVKLKASMKAGIVKFYYKKVDGSLREAYGTLKEALLPPTGESKRRPNVTLFTYFDTEVQEWRSFKLANLVTNL